MSGSDSKLDKVIPLFNLVPFRTFGGPLYHKPVTGQVLFFATWYNKSALGMSCPEKWEKTF